MSLSIQVLSDITVERERQDVKWGGPPHDDKHIPEHWNMFIRNKLNEAERFHICGKDLEYRYKMVEVAALAFASLESFDRKVGKDKEIPPLKPGNFNVEFDVRPGGGALMILVIVAIGALVILEILIKGWR